MGRSACDSGWNQRWQEKIQAGSPLAFPRDLFSVSSERGMCGGGVPQPGGRTPELCSELLRAAVGKECYASSTHHLLLSEARIKALWPLCLAKEDEIVAIKSTQVNL